MNIPILLGLALAACNAPAAQLFDGVDEVSRPAMEEARRRIEAIRKGDFRLRVLDERGRPFTGPARARLTRHAFRFGASGYGIPRLGEAARKQALEAMDELFNTVTVVNYWPENEPARGGVRNWEDADFMAEWAAAHGKTMRFHSLLFPSVKWHAAVQTSDEWWRIVEARIRAVAERYGSRIHEYDVLNEVPSRAWIWAGEQDPTRDSKVFPHFSDTANAVRVFQLARRYLPDAELVDNDQTVATPASEPLRIQLKYNRDLLAAGAPVDVVGHQGHFYASGQMPFEQGHFGSGAGAFTMAALGGGLDLLGSLGKPVHITEFSPPSRDNRRKGPQPRLSDEEVAGWQVNYYTLAFSKPFVHEITRWFVIDELGGRGVDAGVLARDGSRKPAYDALRKLLKETWSSVWEGEVRGGEGGFRGFFGDYEIAVPGYRSAAFTARPGSSGAVEIRLAK